MRSSLLFLLFAFPALAGTPDQPCPNCPPGCIPEAFVQELKSPVPETNRACPASCVAIEKVKVLQDKPGCRFETEQVGAPFEPKSTSEDKPREQQRSTINRGIYLPTAMNAPSGEFCMTGYGLGLWDLQYNLNDNLQLGAQIVLPIYVAGAFPTLRARFDLSEHLAVGVGGLIGLVGPYTGDEAGGFIFIAGGHAQLSFHHGAHLLNLGFVAVTAGLREENADLDMVDGAILLPNLSYRFAFHRNWSFQVEMTAPIVVGSDGAENTDAIFILAYGVRGHGDVLFGDVGFVLPLFDEYIEEVWKYTPIGIPYFSIGFVF